MVNLSIAHFAWETTMKNEYYQTLEQLGNIIVSSVVAYAIEKHTCKWSNQVRRQIVYWHLERFSVVQQICLLYLE